MKRNIFIRILLSLLLLILAMALPLPSWMEFCLFLASYLVIGLNILIKAVRNVFSGHFLDENFLMTIASVGAFVIQEYPEAIAVMMLYQIGEMFQTYAVNRSRKSIADLMDIAPDHANLLVDGQLTQVHPDELAVGDLFVVKPGEKIPLDGIVVKGSSFVDTSALTGESVPLKVHENSEVISGCINQTGMLTIKSIKTFGESTVSKILNLVENAADKKASAENFVTRIAKFYTPIVVGLAVLIAAIPPLVLAQPFTTWLYRALTFLVVSCPCALLISIPLSFFSSIGRASREGILIKGSNYIKVLANTKIAAFDKTGTLTQGTFEVREVHPYGITADELIKTAAYAEAFSNHPIASSIRSYYGKEIDEGKVSDTRDYPGMGILAMVDGASILAGNAKLMEHRKIRYTPLEKMGTVVYIAKDDAFAGAVLIADTIKKDAKSAVQALKKEGIHKTIMLTGDTPEVAGYVANEVGIDEVHASLTPEKKVEQLETFLKETKKNETLLFAGDGINDAPVLAIADIGVAMGALGSDAAIESADVVIMTDEPSKIAGAIGLSKRTLKIVWQNIVFALGIKLAIMILNILGISTMWEAVFADVGVSILAILNAMRILRFKISKTDINAQ